MVAGAASLPLVVVLTACGGGSSGQPTGGSSPSPSAGQPTQTAPSGTPSADSMSPVPPPPGATDRALPTTPVAVKQGYRAISLAWQFQSLSDGGRHVSINVAYSGCTGFRYAQVQQTATAVTL